jgi:hypothetical protein
MKKKTLVGAILGTVVFMCLSHVCTRDGSNKIMESIAEIPQK